MARKKFKRERGRLKVLSDRKRLTSDAKAIYSTNETDSRLLGMPAEIRNRIYRHVLGDKNIHMDNYGRVRYLCSALQTDRKAAKAAIEGNREIGFATWQNNHDRCGLDDYHDDADNDSVDGPDVVLTDIPNGDSGTNSTTLHTSLSLLEVCRQVHSDAALLPFTTNIFTFDRPSYISYFVKRLVPEQRRAITNITVSSRYPLSANEMSSFPKKKVLQTLTGLRHFTLLIEIDSRRFTRAALLETLSETLSEATELLKWVACESALVCVTSRYNQTRHGIPVLQTGDFRMESRKMEHTILHPWDAEEEARRKQEERQRRRELREKTKRETEAKQVAKARAVEIESGQRVATRVQRGLRKVKVASYSA